MNLDHQRSHEPSYWKQLKQAQALAKKEAHVWKVELLRPESEIASLRSLLSADEIERADRFRFDKHRNRYTVGRAILRQLVGEYLERHPKEIQFTYNEQGKPFLKEETSLAFNLSNTQDLAVVAFTSEGRVGIDVEYRRKEVEELELVERFFSKAEVERFLKIPSEQQREIFFTIWTRKEAYLKALGGGLSIPLGSFDVEFDPAEEPKILRANDDDREAERWTLINLEPAEDYAGALLLEGKDWSIRQFERR